MSRVQLRGNKGGACRDGSKADVGCTLSFDIEIGKLKSILIKLMKLNRLKLEKKNQSKGISM